MPAAAPVRKLALNWADEVEDAYGKVFQLFIICRWYLLWNKLVFTFYTMMNKLCIKLWSKTILHMGLTYRVFIT